MHWLLVLLLGVSLATGLRVAADAPEAVVSRAFATWLPQGDVLLWHLASGLLLLGLMLAYGLYQAASGLGRRLVAPWRRTGEARWAFWRRVNLGLYWLAYVLLGVAAVTGMMQYLGRSPVPLALVKSVHGATAWGFLAYVVVHVAAQAGAGGWRRLVGIFVPRPSFGRAGAAGFAAGALALAVLAAVDRATIGTLEVARTDAAPLLDGRPDDPVWRSVVPVRLSLANGANLPGGESEVELRAVHNGQRLWLLVQWTDPTRSQKHVPLIKTEDGWRVLHTDYLQADEDVYYEDKLAIMLAPDNPLAAVASIHLGHAPLAGEPGPPGGRGLHYTTDGATLDVWHWKSVRNGFQNQADDNFFGPPLPAPRETPRMRDPDSGAWVPRYTGGYRKDPPGTYSAYEMNWDIFDGDLVRPLRLPENPRDIAELATADLSPDASDAGQWWIELNDTRPYEGGPDDLPVGTVLPSVLPVGRLTGDRADVSARGNWADGRWHLELSRQLDTGSDKDVEIRDGTLMWVAVFDRTQTRHARHLRPVRLVLR